MAQILRYLGVVTFCWSMAFASTTTPSGTALGAWNGTWKINPDKSQLTGTTYSLTKSANMYHYKGNGFEYDFACDGKDYALCGGETRSRRTSSGQPSRGTVP